MELPAVSVVVPLFNKARYITRCLDSILAQTFTNFELIVVDDGSTDGSGEVAASLQDRRIRVIKQENRGVSGARNRGIAEARGELVALLDADDSWDSRFLEAIVGLSDAYPEAGWFATGYRRSMGTGWDREVTMRPKRAGHRCLVRDYLVLAQQAHIVTSSSVAMRRNVFDRAGLFPENHPLGEDRDTWVRIGARFPLGFDNRILAIYHSDASHRDRNIDPRTGTHPAVASLRQLIESQSLTPAARKQARSYLDWLRFEHAMLLLYGGDRGTIEYLLNTSTFETWGFRIRAAVLKLALRLLPLKLIAAARLKPAAAVWTLRRTPLLRWLVSAAEVLAGRRVVFRSVRPIVYEAPRAHSARLV